jgi:hypothetical protein
VKARTALYQSLRAKAARGAPAVANIVTEPSPAVQATASLPGMRRLRSHGSTEASGTGLAACIPTLASAVSSAAAAPIAAQTVAAAPVAPRRGRLPKSSKALFDDSQTADAKRAGPASSIVPPSLATTPLGQSPENPAQPSPSASQPDDKTALVACPVCGIMISSTRINAHLDTCLTAGTRRQGLRCAVLVGCFERDLGQAEKSFYLIKKTS